LAVDEHEFYGENVLKKFDDVPVEVFTGALGKLVQPIGVVVIGSTVSSARLTIPHRHTYGCEMESTIQTSKD
jgi:hypothetical protein